MKRLLKLNKLININYLNDFSWYYRLRNLIYENPNDKIKIYRLILGDEGTKIDFNNLGKHWTLHKDNLYNEKFQKKIFGDDDTFLHVYPLVIVEAETILDNIDLTSTEYNNSQYPKEYEITIKDDNIINIINIINKINYRN